MAGRKTGQAIEDGLGHAFPTIADMLSFHGVSATAYYKRRKKGLSVRDALTQKASTCVPSTDHLGNSYPSRKAMAEAYGITYNTFNTRLSDGWSLERALTEKPAAPVTDHLGREYPDLAAMAREYGLMRKTVKHRLETGWSLDAALETPAGRKPRAQKVRDHTGREFDSMNSMYAFWGIGKNTYSRRIKSGMSVKEALETPMRPMSKPCTDHLGNKFTSQLDMCRYHHVDTSTFNQRIKDGLPLDQCLMPSRPLRTSCTDWSGRPYKSIKELAAAIHVPDGNLRHHIRRTGSDTARAASIAAANTWPGMHAGSCSIIKCMAFPWFLCHARDSTALIVHADRLMAMMAGKEEQAYEQKKDTHPGTCVPRAGQPGQRPDPGVP